MSKNPLKYAPQARTPWVALLLAMAATVAFASPHLGDETAFPPGPYGASGPGWGDAQFGNAFLQVEAHAHFAGAIGSLKYRDKEYVSTHDHGRELQMAVSLDPAPECLMPTEAGSAADGQGPTSSSRLYAAQVGLGTWQTSIYPAYWLTGICTSDTVAPDLFTKQIQVGVNGNPQVIRYAGQMALARQYPLVYAEIPTLYLHASFKRHYRIDPASGATWQYQAIDSAGGEEEASNVPLIFATDDGAHAIGLWSPFESQGGDFQYRAHMFNFSANPEDSQNTSKMTVTRSWGAGVPRQVDAVSYFAVGTVDSVRLSLMQLYAAEPTGVARNWPAADRREGDQLPPPNPTPPPGDPVTDVSAFDQASPDLEMGNRVKQVAVSSDGKQLIQRYYDGGWKPWTRTAVMDAIGLAAVRSFSQGPDAENKPKQFFLNRAGDTIYSRTFANGSWGPLRSAPVASLGIPGVSRIRSFDRTGPDAAIGNQLKDMVISDDGRTQHYRKFDKATQTWTNWMTGSVSQIGIPGLGIAKSLSQSVTPEGYPKFHLVSGDGATVYTRVFIDGVWGQWSSVSVSVLGM